MDEKRTESFISKSLVWAVAWSFGGYVRSFAFAFVSAVMSAEMCCHFDSSMSLKNRLIFCAQVPLLTNIPLPEQKDQKVISLAFYLPHERDVD